MKLLFKNGMLEGSNSGATMAGPLFYELADITLSYKLSIDIPSDIRKKVIYNVH